MNVTQIVFMNLYNKINLLLRGIEIGKGNHLNGRILFKGRKNIIIGDKNIINSGYRTNPITGFRFCSIGGNGGKVVIGNNVGISNSCVYSCHKIIIEDYVNIGNGCTIIDSDFHPLLFENRIAGEKPLQKEIVIKKGAWIGCNSIILKGVSIGEKSVIAAGSVVTKSVPDGELWGGNPAHFIRKLY